jgi:ABC-type multidrug transport system ATPase subunit
MQIELNNLSKRYRYEWIFRDLSYTFEAGSSYAIHGHNGSGKSTLLQILSAYLSPSEGSIKFIENGRAVDLNKVYRSISFCSPYMELIEELSLKEALAFHQRFKPLAKGVEAKDILALIQLPKSAQNKSIQFFSSGMKQRLKLALAFLSDSSVLLLDEPTITLDQEGVRWYRDLLENYALGERLVVIASNVLSDFEGCEHELNILDYKTRRT